MPGGEAIELERLVTEFASDLQLLRDERRLSFREMAKLTNYGKSVLGKAARGRRLPTLGVTLAFVHACQGPEDEWRGRWAQTRQAIRDLRNGHGRG